MLHIHVPARIHITLLDLGTDGYRRNGGIGFCVDNPIAKFEFDSCSSIDISILKSSGYSEAEIFSLTEKMNSARKKIGGIGVRLKKLDLSSRHTGLGIGTATALACLESIFVLNHVPIDPNELIGMSGRGGTSGVGVHGYSSGGFIFDVGRKLDHIPLQSSDFMDELFSIPLAISKLAMPPEWQIGLFYPPGVSPVSLAIEQNLFATVLPLSAEEIFKTTYHAVFGAVAAVADSDFNGFCRAINEIQDCSWKAKEIGIHEPLMSGYIKSLKKIGCDAVGMSSIGPTLYFLSNDFSKVCERISKTFPTATVVKSFPHNSGRKIFHD